MIKSRNLKLIQVTSLEECWEHRCDDLKAYKSSQLTDLYFKPMQNSPVRTVVYRLLICYTTILPTNRHSKYYIEKLHTVYLKLYKPKL